MVDVLDEAVPSGVNSTLSTSSHGMDAAEQSHFECNRFD